MPSNLLGTTIEDVLGAVLEAEPADVLLVNPSLATLEASVEAVGAHEARPSVRVLAENRILKALADDFLAASEAADLVEADVLELRSVADPPRSSLLLTEERAVALVAGDERVGGLATDDEAFVEAVTATYEDVWTGAEPFSLRTPARSRVDTTLAESLGADVESDFETMLASAATARGEEVDLDEVTVSLLAAARNRELLYDISKWGEDVGVASKATFSRTKSRLEEAGLIATEKEPIDVGRPRLRLKLADERLQDAEPSELVGVAQSVLAC
jgi:hypothetical protein